MEGVVGELPLLVDRLESLRFLHEESAGFMQQLNTLSDTHTQILSLMNGNQKELDKVQMNFDSNLATVVSNVKLIEGRIENLEKSGK